jgi:penicillin amidase
MIVDVGDWDNSVSTLPGGQSGHPASEHYQDSVDDWLQGKYHPMLYSRTRLEAATQNRLVLHPGA